MKGPFHHIIMSEQKPRPKAYGTSESSPASRSDTYKSSIDNSQHRQTQNGKDKEENSNALYLSFVGMVLVGVGNQIFGKLQTLPM